MYGTMNLKKKSWSNYKIVTLPTIDTLSWRVNVVCYSSQAEWRALYEHLLFLWNFEEGFYFEVICNLRLLILEI